MSDLTHRLRCAHEHSAAAYEAEEYLPMARFWKFYEELSGEAADALEAQEARLASMSKALTRLIDATDYLANATNCGLADDAIAYARDALTPSLK